MPPDASVPRIRVARASGPELRGGVGVLLLLIAIFHGGALKNGFVYDDAWTIVGNPALSQPGSVLRLLGRGFAEQLVPDAGRPTMLATEILDHRLWGLSPRGYHLQSLLWHSGVTVLFFLGVAAIFGGFLMPFTAAALFAVHPINVEAVAAINYREDLLAAFFVLACLLLMGAARRRVALGQGAAAAALRATAGLILLVGALAKENATVAPALLLLLDLVRAAREQSRPSFVATLRVHLRDYVSLAIPVALAFCWRTWVMGAAGIVSRTAEVPAARAHLLSTVAQTVAAFVTGVSRIFVPRGFCPDYADALPDPGLWLRGVLSLLGIGVCVVLAARQARKAPEVAFGSLAALVAYAPTLGLIPITNLQADRYFYLPSLGLFLAIAATLTEALTRNRWFQSGATFDLPRAWLGVAALVAVVGARTIRQGRIWRDDLSLWSAATTLQPQSPQAWAALGHAHLGRGQTALALQATQRSLQLSDDGRTHELLGIILLQQGAPQPAHAEFLRALDLGVGDRAQLLNNLGFCELQLRHPGGALTRFEEAQRLSPGYDRPWVNAAMALSDLGQMEQAKLVLRKALVLFPQSPAVQKKMAEIDTAISAKATVP